MTIGQSADAHGSEAERDGLRAALAAAGTGTWRWNAATGLVRWDPTLEALCGLEPGQFGATYEAWLATLHPDERAGILALVQEALDNRSAYRFEHRTIWPDGTVRWLECRGEVLTDAGGDAVGTVGCAVDITARKIAELEQTAMLEEVQGAAERLTRLQTISQQLTAALSVDDVIAVVIRTLDPPERATARALWLLDEATNQLHLADHAGMKLEAADVFQRIEVDADLPGAVAFRERRTVISPSQADSVERFPLLDGAPRTSDGFIAVPLVIETFALGVIAFGYNGPLDEREVSFLEAAAGNIAETLQRVRLADALQRRSEEIAFFADIARAAIVATDHRDLMQRIAGTVVPQLGDICLIHFVPEPGSVPETVIAHSDLPGGPWPDDLTNLFALDPTAQHGIARVMQTGEPEFIPDLTPDIVAAAASRSGHHDPDIRRALVGLNLSSAITVPVVSEKQIIGALQVLARQGGPRHSERDVDLVQGVASGIGDAIASRWLTDQHRHISTTLQRAFLPPALPAIPGLDVVAAYWPAGAASEVGGDFYDVFAIGEDRWAILIGDACGTGPDAAATAAIARHTARAAARHGLGHHEVLEWVNQAVKYSDRNLFCTACYATIHIRPADNSIDLDIGTAGHPLPINVGADAVSSLGAPGTLLGVFDDPTFAVSRHRLDAGNAVVFYTDGITDLPGPAGRTEHDLQNLLAQQHARSAHDYIALLKRDLDERVSNTYRADDVAVLVIVNRSTSE
ncbi:MAG: SpoIIE family protein phosphatase [Actinobacteria bacterium]|nr:SpoIIE family protein phosphatase [Actinomycetota bacterium]